MFRYIKKLFLDVVNQSHKFVDLHGSNPQEVVPAEETYEESGRSSTRRHLPDRLDPREIPRPSKRKRSRLESAEGFSDCHKERNGADVVVCHPNGTCDDEVAVKKKGIEEREERTRKKEKRCRKRAGETCGCDDCSALATMSECCVCLEPLQTRAVRSCPLCSNLICADCSAKLNKCAFCRTSLPSARNRAVERLLARLRLPCRNARNGCERMLTSKERLRHEASCDHASKNCPVSESSCSWQGSPAAMLSHLRQVHAIRPLTDHGIVIEISSFRQKAMVKEREYTIYLSCYNQLFVVKVILRRKKLILTCSKLGYAGSVTGKPMNSRYEVWIKVKGDSKHIHGVLPLGKFSRETREIEISSDKLFSKSHGKTGEADSAKIEILIKEISTRLNK